MIGARSFANHITYVRGLPYLLYTNRREATNYVAKHWIAANETPEAWLKIKYTHSVVFRIHVPYFTSKCFTLFGHFKHRSIECSYVGPLQFHSSVKKFVFRTSQLSHICFTFFCATTIRQEFRRIEIFIGKSFLNCLENSRLRVAAVISIFSKLCSLSSHCPFGVQAYKWNYRALTTIQMLLWRIRLFEVPSPFPSRESICAAAAVCVSCPDFTSHQLVCNFSLERSRMHIVQLSETPKRKKKNKLKNKGTEYTETVKATKQRMQRQKKNSQTQATKTQWRAKLSFIITITLIILFVTN